MFTFYFIIGFILFCLAFLEAIDDLTIRDYRKQIKQKRSEIHRLNDIYDKMMDQDPALVDVDYRPFEETLRKIVRLEKDIESLYIEMNSYPRFYRR